MKLKLLICSTLLAMTAMSAEAGNFQTLTNGNGTNVSAALGGFVQGSNNQNADKLYIETVSATYLTGYDDVSTSFADGGTGDIVASLINYRTFSAGTTLSTGTLTLVDWKVTRGVDLAPGSAQADIFDFVYRDSADNTLVFGTRYLNREDNSEEANYLYRYGFTGYNTAAAWTYSSDYDLRMYQAAKTDSTAGGSVFALSEGTVRQMGDFSLTEENPWSGLFLVKTDATAYTLGAKAIGFYQAGEEGQDPAGGFIGGFVPTTVTPVPEPENFALMMLGLGVIAAARRQKKQA
ncbi:PEP-CTERM sorting domain-containing protein [Methylophilus sp. DW102]|uniref:PEP-CTERM sorting domain-containing protein n=1 Tax=Methylophilus sp. DW102 TaxID=3095607 RepID=UPI00308E1D54|nr:PEP-CTERM sorting domain-containing protein [Methylophilus sp. DW102]